MTLEARWRPWRWPAAVWLSGLALVLLLRFPANFILHPPYLMDFEVYRTVAVRLLQGGAAQLYSPTTSELMPFKYAPCWALLWLPFGWISLRVGAIIWSAMTVLWVVLAAYGSWRLCRQTIACAPAWLMVLAVILLVRPITAEFLNGQVDALWGLLVIGALIAERTRHAWWSATALALAIALKLPALVFLPYLAVKDQWGLAAKTMGLFLSINLAASVLLLPHHPLALLTDWCRVLWSSGTSRAFEIGNQNLLTLLGRFLSTDSYRLNVASVPIEMIWLLTTLASLLLWGLVVHRNAPKRPIGAISVFDAALLTVLMVLCSPTAWIATYTALIFPVTLALATIASHPRRSVRDMLTVIPAAIALLLSVMTHSAFWRALGIRYLRGESYVFLVLEVLPWFGLASFALLLRQRQYYDAA